MATLKTTPKISPKTTPYPAIGRLVPGGIDIRYMDSRDLIAIYPPKVKPMAQGMKHLLTILFMVDALNRWFKEIGRNATVLADCFTFYIDENGHRRPVSPDVSVTFDIEGAMIDNDLSYFIERIGKPPSFALEVGSESTARNDLYHKPAIYAYMGVSQYWLFDNTGGDYYGVPLQGFRLVNGAYKPIETETLPDGSVRGHSDILGLDIYWSNGDMRLRDPSTGRFIETVAELVEDRREARMQLAAESEARRIETEAREAEIAALQEEVARLRGRQG